MVRGVAGGIGDLVVGVCRMILGGCVTSGVMVELFCPVDWRVLVAREVGLEYGDLSWANFC